MIILIIILILICLMIFFLIFYKKPETFENNLKIPKTIYLSYKTKDIPEYVIKKWTEIYPDYKIKLYDNNDCIEFFKL